jgi:hypothetical protein
MRWQKRRVQLKCLGRSRYWLLETGSPNALRSQTDETQATEVAIAVDLLNRMLGWDGRGTSAPHETRRAYPPRTELPLSPGCRVRFQPGPGQSCIDGNDPRVAATTGSDWTGPGAGWGAPRPANDAHSGRSRPQSQGGLPALLGAMVRRSAKLATRSPWRGTAAIRRQARPTRVGTRQSQAVPP